VSERLHYIDWLRVLAVLLLFPFHTGRVFNGDPFYVKAAVASFPVSLALTFIDRWHMPLLFLLAGASTYFALRKRTPGEYVKERGLRLGVPLLFGLIIITPPQGWYGGQFNSGYTGSFLAYIASGRALDVSTLFTRDDYFGGFVIGHLWFILFLLLISLLALPLILWSRGERGRAAVTRWSRRLARPAWWLLPAVVLWIAEGLPSIGSKNLLFYLAWFALGFVAIHDDAFAASAERFRWTALGVGVLVTAVFVAVTPWRNSLPDPSWALSFVNITGMLGAWMTVVGLIGIGRRHLDRPSSTLSYLAEASYPVYILHQTVIVVAAFYIVGLPVAWPLQLAALLLTAVAVTFGLYEIVRRVPPLRFFFGMRPRPRPEQA
jgi:glucan biosynthesis protein C